MKDEQKITGADAQVRIVKMREEKELKEEFKKLGSNVFPLVFFVLTMLPVAFIAIFSFLKSSESTADSSISDPVLIICFCLLAQFMLALYKRANQRMEVLMDIIERSN